MSNLFIPSYAQGYARNAAESENPGLWRGLAGLWMPSLGPTGLTLHDQSGRGNNGTLTDMGPATDWVTTEMGWGLDFDGSNDYVDCGTGLNLSPTEPLSLATVCQLDAFHVGGNWQQRLIFERIDNNNAYQLVSGDAACGGPHNQFQILINKAGVQTSANSSAKSTGVWYHVVGTWDGTSAHLYVDGVKDDGAAGATGGVGSTTNLWIGARAGEGGYVNGRIMSAHVYSRVLLPSEIQQLYVDPHALVQPRRRVFKAAVAVGNRRRRTILFAEAAA